MERIKSCTDALVQAIRESGEYQEFCRIREEVAKDPEKRERINRFRRHIFEVQNTKESVDMYGEMERLCREYEEFRRDPQVDAFLRSELRVCRILQKITEEITQSVELDTEAVTRGLNL